MKQLFYTLLAVLSLSSCGDFEYAPYADCQIDFGQGEYEEPFVGILDGKPEILRRTLQYPPYCWLAPDTLVLKKDITIDFNEEAIRSKSTATISFVDTLYNSIRKLQFSVNNIPVTDGLFTVDANSLSQSFVIVCKVHPDFGDKVAQGYIMVQGNELDQVNSKPIQQDINLIGTWNLKQTYNIPWLLWLLWLITALLIIALAIGILFCIASLIGFLIKPTVSLRYNFNKETKRLIERLISASDYFKEENFSIKSEQNKIQIEYPNSTSKIIIEGKKFYCTAGSTIYNGQMNEFLNHPMPNKIYIVDKHSEYRTDSLGRTKEVTSNRTKLYGNNPIRNTQRNSSIQRIIKEKGFPCDDGGHLISANSNGANEIINQVPMEHHFQANGEWRRFEEIEERAIKSGQNVISRRKLYYKGKSLRPYKIKATTIIEGRKIVKYFKNPIV